MRRRLLREGDGGDLQVRRSDPKFQSAQPIKLAPCGRVEIQNLNIQICTLMLLEAIVRFDLVCQIMRFCGVGQPATRLLLIGCRSFPRCLLPAGGTLSASPLTTKPRGFPKSFVVFENAVNLLEGVEGMARYPRLRTFELCYFLLDASQSLLQLCRSHATIIA